MRRCNLLALITAAAFLAPAAHAACEYPADVKIPDGKNASQEEISAASAAVKSYLASMEAYTTCLDAEAAALPVEQQTPEAKAMHVKRYNAAVDAMELTANSFNEQLRAFKAVKK